MNLIVLMYGVGKSLAELRVGRKSSVEVRSWPDRRTGVAVEEGTAPLWFQPSFKVNIGQRLFAFFSLIAAPLRFIITWYGLLGKTKSKRVMQSSFRSPHRNLSQARLKHN